MEVAKLEGVPGKVVEAMVRAMDNQRTVAKAIGDAMSINVLMRLLPRALQAAGLLGELPLDVWKRAADSGKALNVDSLLSCDRQGM